MSQSIEVLSLAEGAWYDVISTQCEIVWIKDRPHIRIKFL